MPITTIDSTGSLKQGKKIDSATMPTGGKGVIGWLSAMYDVLSSMFSSGVVTTGLPDLTGSGNITANGQSVNVSDVTGYATAIISISGTYNGMIAFRCGGVAHLAFKSDGTQITSSANLLNGTYYMPISSGVSTAGVTSTLWISGSVTVNIRVTTVPYQAMRRVEELNSATIAASLSVLDDWDNTDTCKTSPILGQVGCDGSMGIITARTQRITIGTDDPVSIGCNKLTNWNQSNHCKVVEKISTTSDVTSVNYSASNQTLLAQNSSRLGASFYNDSTSILYLKCGATASTSSYTVKIQPDGYWELPFRYDGIIDGIWSADASGSVKITEFS